MFDLFLKQRNEYRFLQRQTHNDVKTRFHFNTLFEATNPSYVLAFRFKRTKQQLKLLCFGCGFFFYQLANWLI